MSTDPSATEERRRAAIAELLRALDSPEGPKEIRPRIVEVRLDGEYPGTEVVIVDAPARGGVRETRYNLWGPDSFFTDDSERSAVVLLVDDYFTA